MITLLGIHLQQSVLAVGGITGLGYALLGCGIVLVYRATRVLNFAHAGIGAFAATVTAKLVLDDGVPYWLGVLVALVIGAAIAVLFDVVIVRPLSGRPKIVLLVATLGLSQLISAAANLLPQVQHAGPYPRGWNIRVHAFGTVLDGADLTMLIAVPVGAALLAFVLGRTSFGLTVRAASDNAEAARLAGIPVRLVSTTVFAIAGVLAALTIVLYNPVRGISAGTSVSSEGTSLLLRALIAAMAGGFWSLPRTAVAGVVLGAVEAVMYANTGSPGNVELMMFVVLAVVMLVTAGKSQLGGSTAGLSPAAAPVPRELLSNVWSPRLSWTTRGFVTVVAVCAPLVISSAAGQLTLVQILCYALAALSVCVVTGWAGQLSLTQFGFVGIGAFLAARLVASGWNFFVAVVACAVVGAVVAGVLGIPALRARGMYLAVLTLGFADAVEGWLLPSGVLNPQHLTLIYLPPPHLGSLDFGNLRNYYWLCLAVLAIVLVGLHGLRQSGAGRATLAVRDNQTAAEGFAIWGAIVKLKAFALAGAIAAVAGALLGGALGDFQTTQFTADVSISLVFMVVIGGIASLSGPVLAAAALVGVPVLLGTYLNSLSSDVQNVESVLGGLGVLLILRKDPAGIGQKLLDTRIRLLRRLAGQAADADAENSTASPDVPVVDAPAVQSERATVPALRLTNVTVRFGGIVANSGVSLQVGQGEIVGLIGANGAGKSTLMNAVGGFVATRQGSIEIVGSDASRLPSRKRAALGMARSFQSADLFAGLSVSETIATALESEHRTSTTAALLHIPAVRRRDRARRVEADRLALSVGLGPWLDCLSSDLSTGTRRMVEIACVLARSPRLILLDEPTAGVAQREIEQFAGVIRRLRDSTGAGIVLIEHDLPLVMAVCDRVVVLAEGCVIADGTPADVRADPAVIATYLGVDERAVNRSNQACNTRESGAHETV